MPSDNAVFEEVIGVTLDVEAFSQSLNKIIDIYQTKLKELGNSGLSEGFISTSALASINTDLEGVRTNLTALTTAFVDGFGAVGAKISEVTGKAVTSTEEAAAKADETLSRSASKQQKINEVSLRTLAKYHEELDSMASKDAKFQSELYDKDALAQVKAKAKALKEIEALVTKDAVYQSELADKVALKKYEADKKAAEKRANTPSLSNLDKFTSSLVKDIPEMVAGMVKFQIAWALVSASIAAIMAPITLMVSTIKAGWEYLTNLQKSAAELQGVLASNVEFTANVKQNFIEAGIAAEALVVKLQDMAIKTGVPYEQLQSAFKALADSGGASFVNNMGQLADLAGLFAMAVKASGKDFMVQRTLVSEIPALLNGSVKANSLILETLHLTKKQWEGIREEGLKHHDLLQRLAPLMEPFLDVADQATLRMAALNEKLELAKNQISGAIARPLWDYWISILQEAAKWIGTHKDQLINIGLLVIGIIKDFGSLAGTLLRITGLGSLLVTLASALGGSLIVVLGTLRIVMSSIEFVGLALHRLLEIVSSPSKWFKKDEWKKTFDDITDIALSAYKKMKDAAVDTADALDGSKKSSGVNPLDASTKSKRGPKDPIDHLGEIKAQYSEAIKMTEDYFARRYKLQEQALKSAKINEGQYYENVKLLQDAELGRLHEINAEYAKKAHGANGKDGATSVFETSIRKDEDNQDTKIFDARVKNEEQFAAFKKKMSDLEFKDNLAMIASMSKEELATAKANGQSRKGYIALLEKEINDQAYEAKDKEIKRELALDTLSTEQRTKLINEQMRLSYEDGMRKERDIANVKRGNFLDTEKDIKEESAAAHARFNLEAARIAQADKYKWNQQDVIKDQKKLAIDYAKIVDLDVKRTELLLIQAKVLEAQTHDATERLRIEKELDALKKEQVSATTNATDTDKKRNAHDAIFEKIFGDKIDSLKEVFDDGFGKGVEGMTHAFVFFANTISDFINAYKKGSASGGVLGGIGGVMGQAGGIIGSIPGGEVWGAAIQGVGAVLGIIGGMFKAAAKRIAEEMKKSFDEIVKNYSNGTTNLVDTIAQLEQKRQEAINRLSGKKGGKDELAKLLPSFDDEIQQLKKTQADILAKFEDSIQVLNLHSDALGTLLKAWQDINKQVKDYIGAGGDLTKANEFLSLSLEAQQAKAQDTLNASEQQAIQEAIALNDLLTQRNTLQTDFAKTKFNLQNADAIERQQAGAVVRGTQLALKQAEFDKALKAIDDQISLATKKLDLERQVFTVSTDITELHRRDEELTLLALAKQVQSWKDIKSIVDGIVKGVNGFSLTPALVAAIGAAPASTNNTNSNSNTNNNTYHINVATSGSHGFVEPSIYAHDVVNSIRRELDAGFSPTQFVGSH